MVTKTNRFPTLADHAKRLDPDGKVATVVELLSQTNPILDDMVFIEGNLETGHRTTMRTGLPQVFWRALNQGVPSSKSTTVQIDETCAMLETYAKVDKDLAMLNGNTSAFRLSEDMAFLEAMNQEMANVLFYGDSAKDPKKFLGFAPRYSDMAAQNAQNIIDAGGTATDNTSIWLVCWGPNTVHGIYPKGSKAGLTHNDLGESTLSDDNGGEYQGYRTHYQWKSGLAVKDWRYIVRIANIDVNRIQPGAADPIDLVQLMAKALHRIPNLQMGKPVFYCNRTVSEFIDIQSLEKASLALKVKETEGEFWNTFRSIPIRQCDVLVSGEERVQ